MNAGVKNAPNALRIGQLRGLAQCGLGAVILTVIRSAFAAQFAVCSLDRAGILSWTSAFSNGVCSAEISSDLSGFWWPGPNAFTSGSAGQLRVPMDGDKSFYRLRMVDVSATREGFTNLVHCYGILETIAGIGAGQIDGLSYWQPSYEGGPAAAAALSRPHYAQADRAGNIYIADKNSHSILKITPDGN